MYINFVSCYILEYKFNSKMSNLNLFSQLTRKIFHDLINPASAALNGMELLKYNLAEKKDQILDDETFQLLETSIKKITAQIKFFRFCYSDPITQQHDNLSIIHISSVINDYFDFTKLKISHRADLVHLDKKYAILLTNTIIIFLNLFPVGAEIYFDLVDQKGFVIKVNNQTGKINTDILQDFYTTNSDNIENIQVRYLHELLNIYNLNKVVSANDMEVSIEFIEQI